MTVADLLETLFATWADWTPGRWLAVHAESSVCSWVTWDQNVWYAPSETETWRERFLGWPGQRPHPDAHRIRSALQRTLPLSRSIAPVRQWPLSPHDAMTQHWATLARTLAWHRVERGQWTDQDSWGCGFEWLLRDQYRRGLTVWRQHWQQGDPTPPPLPLRAGFDAWDHWAGFIHAYQLDRLPVIPAPTTTRDVFYALTDWTLSLLFRFHTYPMDHGLPATVTLWQGWDATDLWDALMTAWPECPASAQDFPHLLAHVLEWPDWWNYGQDLWLGWIDGLTAWHQQLPPASRDDTYPAHTAGLSLSLIRPLIASHKPDTPSGWLNSPPPVGASLFHEI
jgi:hypothetical protein